MIYQTQLKMQPLLPYAHMQKYLHGKEKLRLLTILEHYKQLCQDGLGIFTSNPMPYHSTDYKILKAYVKASKREITYLTINGVKHRKSDSIWA
jgi:hypothetical protein